MGEVERERASFQFESTGPACRGIPVVNGHELMSVMAADVHLDAESLPVVTLKLFASDLVKLGLGATEVRMDEGTREALISLGWTPPGEPLPPEPVTGGVTLEPREHAYPAGGILSVGSEPVTP